MNNLLEMLGEIHTDTDHKRDRLEPKVKIGQRCEWCGEIFAKKHPKSDERICYRCKEEL